MSLLKSAAPVLNWFEQHSEAIGKARTDAWAFCGHLGVIALAGSRYFGASDGQAIENTTIGMVGGFFGSLAYYVLKPWLPPWKHTDSSG